MSHYVSKTTAQTLHDLATQQVARALGIIDNPAMLQQLHHSYTLTFQTTIGPMDIILVAPTQISPRKWLPGWLAVQFDDMGKARQAVVDGVLLDGILNRHSGKYNAMNTAYMAHHLQLFRAIVG